MARVLITGAAGAVGGYLRAGLPGLGWQIRGFDRVPGEGLATEDWHVGDIRDAEALDAACDGVDAIIHLAGIPVEAPFADILSTNIDGTYQVFEAARRCGVRRVVYASSNHAVGFTPRTELAGVDTRQRPDTYYGLSKVFGEGIGSLYADKYGLEVVAVRIGSCFPVPRTVRMLESWLSPADAVDLFRACLTTPGLRYEVVYGISANSRAWWDLAPARKLGYDPQDDAEAFAADVLMACGPLDESDPEYRYLGGAFTTHEP
ncbi:NAD-dependent dehydratase [Streptomyces tateyamensis]|uniref:NAD-dependent dehydratase n=1 Tax=Streptomyces tateyamensis TaxID=565073 RepID=A0A2V4P0W3_9ACTN|nr:NAD(P)-dependent oxidoreductase [Streptomyces tateyamensis]PYC83195.1 NAD-dependent dehydratase [Streptomyces tateyamensis]